MKKQNKYLSWQNWMLNKHITYKLFINDNDDLKYFAYQCKNYQVCHLATEHYSKHKILISKFEENAKKISQKLEEAKNMTKNKVLIDLLVEYKIKDINNVTDTQINEIIGKELNKIILETVKVVNKVHYKDLKGLLTDIQIIIASNEENKETEIIKTLNAGLNDFKLAKPIVERVIALMTIFKGDKDIDMSKFNSIWDNVKKEINKNTENYNELSKILTENKLLTPKIKSILNDIHNDTINYGKEILAIESK